MAKVVLKLGDDVSTDVIYPGRFMATVLPSETPAYAFADMAIFNAALNRKAIASGSVILAGDNFGCGSSREQAASCLCGHGLIVVAKSFARIFLQNAINLGLSIVIVPNIEAFEDEELAITDHFVINRSREETYPIHPLPQARQAIIHAGGLIGYTRKRISESKLNVSEEAL